MDVPALTRELAAIPSHADETAAGDAIEAWLRAETDAAVRRDAHGNVIARRAADGGDSSLAFVGHHDVVPPDDDQLKDAGEYHIEERDGRLCGRGTADMKGALAAALEAFRAADPAGELVFTSFVGEETGGRGARGAIADGFAPDAAVIVEGSTGYSAPGVTDVAVAHKGRRESRIIARGRAAHASEVAAGDNAIYRAADAIDVIRGLSVPEATVFDHELEGTLAVTEITGGSATNVIPERCAVTVDERTVPDAHADLAAVEAIAGVTWSVEQDLPPMACDDPAFAEAVLDAAAAVQPGDPAAVVKPHATDAGWLAQAGTTTVVCGPGELGEAHTADESVSIDVLERCGRLYREIADRHAPAAV